MTRISFWHGLRLTYGGSLAFLRACPWLALVPVAFELLQHIVEVRGGMYESLAAAQAHENDPVRLGFGYLKILALTVPTWWVVRFLPRRDAAFASRIDWPALRLFAGFLAVQMGLAAIDLFVLPRSNAATGWALLAGLVEGGLMCAWAVAAPLGNASMGLLASIRLMWRHLPWTLAFQLVAMLPLMILHYALGLLPLFSHRGLMWPALLLDTLVVGALTPVLIASSFYAAQRSAMSAGVSLLPVQDDPGVGAAGLAGGTA